jgi:hypothetical protein
MIADNRLVHGCGIVATAHSRSNYRGRLSSSDRPSLRYVR